MKTFTNFFLLLIVVFSNSNLHAKDTWGDVRYNTKDISKGIQENERILSVAKKIQCKYFETHNDVSIITMDSAKILKDVKDQVKLKAVSEVVEGFKDRYCSGKERINPESFAGSLHARCDESCRSEFKSKLQVIGKYETSEMLTCLHTCNEYLLPVREMSKIVIEADAHFSPASSKDCTDTVNSGSRSKVKSINDRDAGNANDDGSNFGR